MKKFLPCYFLSRTARKDGGVADHLTEKEWKAKKAASPSNCAERIGLMGASDNKFCIQSAAHRPGSRLNWGGSHWSECKFGNNYEGKFKKRNEQRVGKLS